MRYVEIENDIVITGIQELPEGFTLPDFSSVGIQVVEITNASFKDDDVVNKKYLDGDFVVNPEGSGEDKKPSSEPEGL